MKAFVSYSGGKDCLYALHLFLQENEILYLVNMCHADHSTSGSHGLPYALLSAQAAAMNIPLMQQPIENGSYEQSFKKVIGELKKQGVTAGVFGDIYLEGHREWIERVCGEMGITAVFPLWERDTFTLMQDLIADGFKTITVAVNKTKLPKLFLGRAIDEDFLTDIRTIRGIDICGENGEYHTFVFDAPVFRQPVSFTIKQEYENNEYWFLELNERTIQ